MGLSMFILNGDTPIYPLVPSPAVHLRYTYFLSLPIPSRPAWPQQLFLILKNANPDPWM